MPPFSLFYGTTNTPLSSARSANGQVHEFCEASRVTSLDPYDFADLDGWPQSWKFTPADVLPGQRLVGQVLKPFLFHLAETGVTRRTFRRHVDNAWVLGGELIRHIHVDPRLRRRPEMALDEFIERGAGPVLLHEGPRTRREVEITFRALVRFLGRPPHTIVRRRRDRAG